MNTDIVYESTEKREYSRIKYLITDKPKLKVGKRKYKVLDISQRGLKFLNNEKFILPEYIHGKLNTFMRGIFFGSRFSYMGTGR